MDRLELNMCECRFHQQGGAVGDIMEKLLEVPHAFPHLLRRRWNELGVPWPRSSYPVLRSTELSRRLFTPSPLVQQYAMDLPNQPQR